MAYSLSNNSKKNREGIHPHLIEICDLAIKLSVVDFGIPKDGGIRTAVRQRELFDDEKSKADGVIRKSKHQSGRALDFYAYVDGKASWDTEHLAMVATAFLQAASLLGYQLKWGGLWKNFKDMPHVQLYSDQVERRVAEPAKVQDELAEKRIGWGNIMQVVIAATIIGMSGLITYFGTSFGENVLQGMREINGSIGSLEDRILTISLQADSREQVVDIKIGVLNKRVDGIENGIENIMFEHDNSIKQILIND